MAKRAASADTMFHLAAASWETIFRRSMMMASGTCSAAEYSRMVTEKMAANQEAALALMFGQGMDRAMQPYLKTARANSKRLRSGG